MITKFGKRFLTSYIAGASDFNSKDLAIGIGNTAVDANGNDTKLEFEFYRLPVTLGSFDISQTGVDGGGNPIFAYTAIYKATVPQDVSGVISEVGLYPGVRSSNNSYDSKFITSFENNINWLDSSNNNPVLRSNSTSPVFTAKIGESMVQFDVNQSTSKEYKNSIVNLDLSGYSVNDSLSIAYKKNDNNVTAIRVKLYSSETQYYYADFTPSSGTGDKIQSISMSSVFSNISTTAPDPTNITKIGVQVTAGSGGPTTVYFDGLRINDEDTFDPQYGLISRSVLTTPLQKPSGRPVDIEYKLQLEF
jgi:hypothetical protein